MRFEFTDTALRVRDLDGAIDFFTKVLGMSLEARVKSDWTQGEFANLRGPDRRHKLELNWYADGSPVAGPFREGDELDHLGFEVDDFDGALRRLKEAGYTPEIGPFHVDDWHIAFVPVIEKIWLDVYHVEKRERAVQRKAPAKRRKKRSKR